MKKPYENQNVYDPGRLRHNVTFVQDQTIDTESGGTSTYETNLLVTKAGKDNMSTYTKSNIVSAVDATFEDNFTYFTIRNRKTFYPDKTMFIRTSFTEKWQIINIKPLGDPCTFIQLSCVLSK